jgi:hypothetical protein
VLRSGKGIAGYANCGCAKLCGLPEAAIAAEFLLRHAAHASDQAFQLIYMKGSRQAQLIMMVHKLASNVSFCQRICKVHNCVAQRQYIDRERCISRMISVFIIGPCQS